MAFVLLPDNSFLIVLHVCAPLTICGSVNEIELDVLVSNCFTTRVIPLL